MREADVEGGRLGDDRAIRLHVGEEVARAEAAVLLIGDGGDEQITAQAGRRIRRGPSLQPGTRPGERFMS